MLNRRATAALITLALTAPLAACGESGQQGQLNVQRDIIIAKPASEVWSALGDFSVMHTWHPAVTETLNRQQGNERILVLGDGGRIHERLTDYDDHSYTYEIIDGPLPVARYVSTVMMTPISDDETRVSWSGSFDSSGASDAEAVKVITSIYDSGLENLAQLLSAY